MLSLTPSPGSNTHGLSIETQISSTNSPKPAPRAYVDFIPGSVLPKADVAAYVHSPGLQCAQGMAIGWSVYLVNSERQVEKIHPKGSGLEATLNLEMIFRRTQISTCGSEKITLYLNFSQAPI